MENILKEAINAADADYIEIRFEETSSTKIIYLGKELETIGESRSSGGCVRACIKGGWGFVSFNDVKELNKHINVAIKEAKLIGKEKTLLGKVPIVKDKIKAKVKKDPRKISLSEKHKLISSYNKIILEHSQIQSSRIRYRDIFTKKYFLNSEGTNIYQEKIDTGIGINAIAREGDNVQSCHLGIGGTDGFQILDDLEDKVDEITHRAIDLLKAEKITGGKYTVVADPELTGVFAHEAFGHMSEGDFLYENKEIQELMKVGKRFGGDFLNIIDDGTISEMQGTSFYDDEGIKTQRTYLIKNGHLISRLHSRETAAKMGEKPTGNARALNYHYSPIVRMTNTFIEPQKFSFEELIDGVEFGIYAKGDKGGQTNCELFTFGAMEGYLIEKGKITKKLRDIILSGNIFETLFNIDAIGSDLILFGGVGGCGKAEQVPLPISIGGPHIRIKNLLVG